MVCSDRTVVVLLHKHFPFIPSPFFNSPNIITNCQYAAMSKPNLTVYDGCPENKFGLRMVELQHCSLDGAHVCQVFWFCGKAQAVHRHSNSVYASSCVFMFKKENPAACEMRSVICFLNAKNMKPAEIHCQLCDVYGEHATSSSVVQRWVWLSDEGHDNVHDYVRGWLTVVNEDLVRAFEGKVRENRRFIIMSLSLHFLKFHGHFFTKLCLVI